MKTEGTISIVTGSTPDIILKETTPRKATSTATDETSDVVLKKATLEKTDITDITK
ncbi:1166_t:CDS:1, partial [Cetraspora pellucida]